MEQPRETNGQFAPIPQQSSGEQIVYIKSDDEYNADGSYIYPAPPRSVEQNMNFWMNVPIEDTDLNYFVNTYREVWRDDKWNHKDIERPDRLYSTNARILARVGNMVWHSKDLGPEAYEQTRQIIVELEANKMRTAGRLYDYFHLEDVVKKI